MTTPDFRFYEVRSPGGPDISARAYIRHSERHMTPGFTHLVSRARTVGGHMSLF